MYNAFVTVPNLLVSV